MLFFSSLFWFLNEVLQQESEIDYIAFALLRENSKLLCHFKEETNFLFGTQGQQFDLSVLPLR